MSLTNFPPDTAIEVCLLIYCAEAGTTDSAGELVASYRIPGEYAFSGTWNIQASGGGKSASARFTFY